MEEVLDYSDEDTSHIIVSFIILAESVIIILYSISIFIYSCFVPASESTSTARFLLFISILVPTCFTLIVFQYYLNFDSASRRILLFLPIAGLNLNLLYISVHLLENRLIFKLIRLENKILKPANLKILNSVLFLIHFILGTVTALLEPSFLIIRNNYQLTFIIQSFLFMSFSFTQYYFNLFKLYLLFSKFFKNSYGQEAKRNIINYALIPASPLLALIILFIVSLFWSNFSDLAKSMSLLLLIQLGVVYPSSSNTYFMYKAIAAYEQDTMSIHELIFELSK